ncbi:hypothetical protein VTN77DRAFT_1427 [Rasamsonia byssochlamydoides]|uniref:uncharacterized protein n=1 Tax=Rasamsonia byssochlamydoides TaxID=89139 RepID=UPI0037427CB0
MSGRPRRACNQCNQHKVRCSGHRPACQRCQLRKVVCEYVTKPGSATFSRSDIERNASAPTSSPLRSLVPNAAAESSLDIPSSLLSGLVNTYFSHLYNASLLLHKPTLLQELAKQKFKPQVVLSVCASASKFFKDVQGKVGFDSKLYGHAWADRASKLVFQEIEEPNEDNLITLVNLSLYWYSQGEWRKSTVMKGNATTISHILGLHGEYKKATNDFESERRRRLYWACYLHSKFASDDLFTNPAASEAENNLFLPSRDEDYERKRCSEPVTVRSGRSNGSIYGELVKGMRLWCKVRTTIAKSDLDMASYVATLYGLDDEIASWRRNLPEFMVLGASMMNWQPHDALPRLLLINIIYHQCLCALHSSIVPLFCCGNPSHDWETTRTSSARVAYEHANAMSELIGAALNMCWDVSRIPSFVGFAAYCASAIQIPFTWCSDPEVAREAHQNVTVNVNVIRELGKYWKLVALLETNLRTLWSVHASNPPKINGESKFVDVVRTEAPALRSSRARESVLGHNTIIRAEDGSIAKDDSDLTDLKLGQKDINTEETDMGNTEFSSSYQQGNDGGVYDYQPSTVQHFAFLPSVDGFNQAYFDNLVMQIDPSLMEGNVELFDSWLTNYAPVPGMQ